MAKYDVTLDSFSAEENTSGKTVVLKYCDFTKACSNANYDLPSLGDSLTSLAWFTAKSASYDIFAVNTTWANCKCTSKKSTVIGAGTETMLVTFSTEPAQDEYVEESLRIGGDFLVIEDPGASNGVTFETSGNKFEGPYRVFIPIADYEVTSYYTTLTDAASWSNGSSLYYFYDYSGSVLQATTLSGNTDGYWLLSGVDVQPIVDRNGDTKYRRTEQYKMKFIRDKNGPTETQHGWNSLYDIQQKRWDQVTPKLYNEITQANWPRTMPTI